MAAVNQAAARPPGAARSPIRPGRRRRHQPITAAPLKYPSWSPPTTAATTATHSALTVAALGSALSADGKMEAAPTTDITRTP